MSHINSIHNFCTFPFLELYAPYILTTIYVYCSGGVASPSSRSLGSMCTCRPAERRVIFMFSRRADRSADHWAILPKRSDSVSLQTTLLCFKIYFSYEL